MARQWSSPERNRVWTEPPPSKLLQRRPVGGASPAVEVIYYLSRNGTLEHPHVVQVLPSYRRPHLSLRDVTDRLDAVRGKGMAAMYSWSAKRAFKNGYVWHDLAADDVIFPVHHDEYILKGSLILIHPSPPLPQLPLPGTANRRRNKTCSMSSAELAEYNLDDTSPPPPPLSDSPDAADHDEPAPNAGIAGTRMRASAMLMQLISCGSIAADSKGGAASRPPVRVTSDVGNKKSTAGDGDDGTGAAEYTALDRDYFSGSLVETRKTAGGAEAGLKRSSSYNADRRAKVASAAAPAEEAAPARSSCIPGRSKLRAASGPSA